MSNTIEEQFTATGYAKVLVVVKTAAVSLQPTVALRATTLAASVAGWEQYFVVAPYGQDAALATSLGGKTRLRRATKAGLGLALTRGPVEAPPAVRSFPYLGLLLGTVDPAGLARLKHDDRVTAVHAAPPLSLIRPVTTGLARKAAGVTWGLERLGVPELWAAGIDGRGVVVGHLDTGIDGAHPALKGAIASFAEFDLQAHQVPGARPRDSDEHGTHTAGTIVGRRVGTSAFGVAPGARLASAMVIEGGEVVARILAGMNWALSMNVRILSMSLGLRGYTEDFLPVTQALRARNVLPVFAAGNDYAGLTRSPGNYAEALSVGACQEGDTVPAFSSSGHFNRPRDPIVPDLVAPGVGVLSCVPGDRYAVMDGTSMATPHVAGLAALLLQARPEASVDELEQAIFDSCKRPAGITPDRGGRGIPSAPRAFELLTGHAAVAKAPAPAARRPGRPARAGAKKAAHSRRKRARGSTKRRRR